MSNPRRGIWTSYKVQSYIIEHYEGITEDGPKPQRQFMWADSEGEVWIGNSAAFAEHLAERFRFESRKYDYVSVNSVLLDCGERIEEYQRRAQTGYRTGQEPVTAIKKLAT
jgi:hypothetical protein